MLDYDRCAMSNLEPGTWNLELSAETSALGDFATHVIKS
jgi:hypothetical protein